MGESFLSRVAIAKYRRKGSGLTFPHTDVDAVTHSFLLGQTRWRRRWAELSFLFDRFCEQCGIRLSGETRPHGQSAGLFPASSSPSTALETLSADFKHPRRGVPITASGPRGEQPLLYMNNAGKGSRQIRPVTLGKGLALVLRGIGCRCVVSR